MKQLKIIAFLLLLVGLHATASVAQMPSAGSQVRSAGSQVPSVQARWYPVEGDSMRVEYALPAAAGRPAVIVLTDRYGLQSSVRSILQILARLGFRAYAPPLLSAPEQSFDGTPTVVIDSADIERVTRAAVDIMSEEGCDGQVYLLAYDIGANIAAELIARFPFYEAAALFYPTGGLGALRRLVDAQCPMQLHVAQYDADCTLEDVDELRDVFVEKGRRLHVFFYKDAKRFFFNPSHSDFHKANTQTAWNHIHKYFRMK